jgi:four helix bundle protein
MNSKELETRLKSLAYRVVNLCDALPKKKISKVVEDKLLRSAFSAAANYRAACKGISKKSFIAKLSIAFEEADESLFWIEVINELQLVCVEKLSAIIKEATELASILAAARKTAQKNIKAAA